MADNGIAPFPPIASGLLTTTLANVGTAVPASKHRTLLFGRAVNETSTDQTVTILMGTGKLASNTIVPANDGVDIIVDRAAGPYPVGTQMQARASAPNAISIHFTGTDRSV